MLWQEVDSKGEDDAEKESVLSRDGPPVFTHSCVVITPMKKFEGKLSLSKHALTFIGTEVRGKEEEKGRRGEGVNRG